jgi:hypothetical protein
VIIGGYDQALTGDGKWFSFNGNELGIKIKPLKPFESVLDSKVPWDKLSVKEFNQAIGKRMKSQIVDWRRVQAADGGDVPFSADAFSDAAIWALMNVMVTLDGYEAMNFPEPKEGSNADAQQFKLWFMRILGNPASFVEGEASGTF